MGRHPIEPFRIKAVEPIRQLSQQEREKILTACGFNIFNIRAEDVFVDLLTDSGTSAMSDSQWGGLMQGDESYAGCRNFFHLEEKVQEITGYPHVVPTHQGRSAEHILFSQLLNKGDYVVSNTHFDTTRANVLYRGAIPVDFPDPSCADVTTEHPFKGNIDLAKLESFVEENKDRIKLCILTITNNTVGGQPVSLANVEATADIVHKHGIPLLFDCARYAENAWFISQREPSQQGRAIRDIARSVFDCGDGCLMSSKKDAMTHIGGFIAVRDESLMVKVKEMMVVVEGFPTYGGLAGRDLEALARGLEECLDPAHLAYRTGQVKWLADRLADVGAEVVQPVGGHAVFIDAGSLYPNISPTEFPGQTLAVGFYRQGGVRAVEIGTLMFGYEDPQTHETVCAPHELVRLAIPRRVYTQTHLEHVVETFAQLYKHRDNAAGFGIEYESPYLRHFTVRLHELPVHESAGAVRT
jgi:tryptophanase